MVQSQEIIKEVAYDLASKANFGLASSAKQDCEG